MKSLIRQGFGGAQGSSLCACRVVAGRLIRKGKGMAAKSTEDCFHEERDYLGLYRIETKATTQSWIPGSPVLPGHVWRYTYGCWENKEKET